MIHRVTLSERIDNTLFIGMVRRQAITWTSVDAITYLYYYFFFLSMCLYFSVIKYVSLNMYTSLLFIVYLIKAVTHIYVCIGNLTIIGSDNGLSPGSCQAIIWTNVGILVNWTLRNKLQWILIEILIFWLKKMRLKVSSAKSWPFCLGLNVLYTSPGFNKAPVLRLWDDFAHRTFTRINTYAHVVMTRG